MRLDQFRVISLADKEPPLVSRFPTYRQENGNECFHLRKVAMAGNIADACFAGMPSWQGALPPAQPRDISSNLTCGPGGLRYQHQTVIPVMAAATETLISNYLRLRHSHNAAAPTPARATADGSGTDATTMLTGSFSPVINEPFTVPPDVVYSPTVPE